MQIETLAIDRLIPYARNSRTHSDAQVAQIAASIKEFGFTNPVLIDADGGIIAGHGRVMGARLLGLADVPCIRLGHLTEAQRRAYVIADNRLALNAGWDDAMLALEMRDLMDEGYDVGLTGFDMKEIDELLAGLDATPQGHTDPDAAPAVQAEAITQQGDVWLLGRHRVMCGDSTNIDAVEKLMEGNRAEFCFTSPPYNLGKSVGLRNGARNGADSAYNDFADSGEWENLMRGFINNALIKSDVTAVNVQMLSSNKFDLLKLFGDYSLHTVDMGIWAKTNPPPAMAEGVMTSSFEFIWFLSGEESPNRRIKTSSFDRGSFSNVFIHATASGHDASVHGAVFPLSIAEHYIEGCSKKGNTILEFFGGTGTTLVACEKIGRINRSMELDPKYCDVIVRRWQQFTGKRATLEATGTEFPG
jgi:DNA modification methylase